MANRSFTVLIVPERSSRVRRIQVPSFFKTIFGVLAVAIVGMTGAAGAHYYFVIDQVYKNRELVQENSQLKDHIAQTSTKLEEINTNLTRLDEFDRKLREITRLSDPTRGLSIGPVDEPVAAGGSFDLNTGLFTLPPLQNDPEQQKLEYALLNSRLHGLAAEARRQEASLRELSRYFAEQNALLDTTPSVWPVRGWVTSEFGMRDDPYTGARSMHLGIDISTPEGKPIMSPANGTVVFAGDRGGYGNVVVLDHGMGVTTFYAHLKEYLVAVGEKVQRGQHIGAVGNSGRSTGPHLHYEARVHGIPVNPRSYILH